MSEKNKKKPDLNIKPARSYLDSLGDFASLLGTIGTPRASNADPLDDILRDAESAARDLEREIDKLTPPAPPPTATAGVIPQQIPEQKPPEKTLDELLAELDELVGLDEIKKSVRSLINLVKVRKLRKEAELPVTAMSLHMVFLGNPGTGKTTVARILGGLYRAIGVLDKGHLVETDRSGLVAGFVGQTAIKTSEIVKSALGGILFIDEAYSLSPERADNDFGREAIETLLKLMEDHRDQLVVIVAGYSGEMDRFIHSNPGLESRFNRYFKFPDYSADQLYEIFEGLCRKNEYTMSEDAQGYIRSLLIGMYTQRGGNFGNARDVRNLFEKVVAVHADRLAAMENPSKTDLSRIMVLDITKI